jgi:hypothetical protein
MLSALLAISLCTQAPSVVFPAGAYAITTSGPTSIVTTANSVTLSWGVPGPAPASLSGPPVPAPAPVPVFNGHIWAAAIYDPEVALPAAQRDVLFDEDLRAKAFEQDVQFEAFGRDDSQVSTWLVELPRSGLPALLFVQQTESGAGRLVYRTALPESADKVLSLIYKLRGKKMSARAAQARLCPPGATFCPVCPK